LQQTEELTRLQLEVGAGTSLDVLQASGDVSSTAANIPSLEISLAESIHALSVLIGQEPSALGGLFESSASVPRLSASISPGIPADLVRNRPDIRSAERALAAATARIGVAEADLYPSFSLTGTLTALASTTASTSWSFAPGINLPIFNAGARKAAVNLAESSVREQYLAYRQAVLSAMEDVENALVAYGKQGERRAHLSQSVARYSEAVELLRTSYEDGNASLLELLTAQSSLYSAEDALVQANAALATQYVALCKALGGGWDIASSAQ
jgi:multidrug efflux system outer membrane protein